MSEERGIFIPAEVDTTRTRAGFNEIAQQGESMAGQVTRSGEQAQRAVSNIGAGAGRSAQSVEAAQRNIIGSIQRTTAAMQAGSRSGAEYYEVLAPYLAQLRAVEGAQQQVGMSTRAYSAAMRNVPAQITDIVTSLQGGMPPLTVAIQQGGQLRDMFGGIVPAARALSTQLLAMVTPYTVVGAALAAIGVAYYQGSKEADAFRLSIIATGNAAGVTASQLGELAKRASASAGTQGANAEAIAALVGTGRVAADQLVAASIAAVSAQKYLGIAVDATVKSFADLGEGPLKATLKLNEQYGYLTLATYKQIQALEEQGKKSDAAKVAQAAYADMLSERSKTLEGSLGTLEKGWNLLGSAAKSAWDRMLDIGRETTLEDKIKAARQRLADAQSGIAAPPTISTTGMAPSLGFGTGQKETEKQAQKELDALLAQEDKQKRLAAIEAERNRLAAAGIKWAEDGEQYLTRAQGLQKALNESRERGLAAGESDVAIAKRALAIRAQYADVVNAGAASQLAAIERLAAAEEERAKRARILLDMEQQVGGPQPLDKRMAYAEAAAKLDEEAIQREKARAQQRLAITAAETVSEDQRAAHNEKLAALRGQIALADEKILTRRANLSKELTAMDIADTKAAQDSLDKLGEARSAEAASLEAQVKAQRDANAVIGLSRDQADAYKRNLVEEAAAQKEAAAALLSNVPGRVAESDALRRSAAAMRELADAQREGALKSDLAKFLDPNKAQSFGDALRDAFGGATSSLVKLSTTFQSYAKGQREFDAQRKGANELFTKGQITEAAYTRDLSRLNKMQTQEQLKGYGDMAGAAAGFFGEQSKGYQTLQAVSQVFHAAELAMTLAELVPKGISAVLNQGQGDPYSAFARMAAMAALVAGLGVAIGGGGSSSVNVSKQRQETQGTGSVFGDLGTKQANGDILYSEKSDSIGRALELTASNSSIELDYTLSMRNSLRSIESSMSGLGNLLVRTSGLTSSTFTDQESSAKSLYMSMQPFWSIGAGTVGKWVSSVFGGKKTVEDTGFTIDPTTLASAMAGNISSFQYAQIKKDGGWFSRDKVTTDRNPLGVEADAQFAKVITSLGTSVSEAAKLLGLGGNEFTAKLNSFVVDIGKISLKGLTGEEIQEQLEAVFSKLGDDMAQFGVAGLEQFQQVGEGYFETLTRVATNYANLDSILAASGATFGKTGLASIEARERLLALAGGIDELASQQSSFNDNFLTQAERLAPVQKYVTDQLAAMGLQSLDSRDKFKDYVLGLANSGALVTEEGAKTYASLLALAESFAKVHAASEDLTKSQQEIADERKNLQDQYDQLTMTSIELRVKERAAVDASNVSLYDAVAALNDLKAAATRAVENVDSAFSVLQRVIEREKSARRAAHDAELKAIQERIDVSTGSITKLRTVSDALNSTLSQLRVSGTSDADQRVVAQAQIQAALAMAKAGGPLPTADSLKSALSAITKDASDQFATYDEYLADLYRTQNDVAALGQITDASLSVEQKTLDLLKNQKDANQEAYDAEIARLDGIVESVQSQIDVLKGMDTSLLTIDQSLQAVLGAILQAQAVPSISANSAITKTYQETLGRAPDQAGLDYWTALANKGTSLDDITGQIKNSAEARIQALYKSLFGRTADAGGLSYWMGELNRGMSIEQIRALMMGGDEYKKLRSFAVGTNRVPFDMAANIHEDERIIPAADNRELMARLSTPVPNFEEMVAELRAAREENAKWRASEEEHLYAIAKYTRDASDSLEAAASGDVPLTTKEVA